MYAIIAIDPAAAMRFEGLAPFEVRGVLYELGALERVTAVGATLMGRPIGLGLAARGWAEPGALPGAPEVGTARLLCLTVARGYRRLGVGRALLGALETALVANGVRSLACNYALPPSDGLVALEALFGATGWSAPEVTMLQCRAGRAVLDAPMLRDQLALPPEYEIVDWIDLTEADRALISERQRREPWFPPSLDPFHFEPDMEVLNSLALRYRGEVVGWLITRRTGATTMYYRCLFVREDLARLGRGMALMCEAIRRHERAIDGKPGLGEWSTPASLPAMVRFIKRHLAPFGAEITEQRVVRKSLTPALTRSTVASRATRHAISRVPLLSVDECEKVLADVRAERDAWTARSEPVPFHTLGAVAAIDAFDRPDDYERTASRVNPALQARFGWLYERLQAALAVALAAPVAQHAAWARPAFQIRAAVRGANIPLAAVHCDVAHTYLEPGTAYATRPIAFTLLLSRPDARAGLTVWQLGSDETVGLDTEETSRLLDAVPREVYGLAQGELLVHPADRYHQTPPLSDLRPGTERVTLDGQAVFGDGRWQIYG